MVLQRMQKDNSSRRAASTKRFYLKAGAFWLVLLVLAIVNAVIRETTYKPLLSPHIGLWAHQISSLTGIALFFAAIYVFLKRIHEKHSKKDVFKVGFMWALLTIIFETLMNIFIRKLSFAQVLQTYYFWNGETWIFVLASLVISPLVIHEMLKKRQ